MLEEDRGRYIEHICDELKDILPDVLKDEEQFKNACKVNLKNWKLSKKKIADELPEGEEVEVINDEESVGGQEDDDAHDVIFFHIHDPY